MSFWLDVLLVAGAMIGIFASIFAAAVTLAVIVRIWTTPPRNPK